MPSIEVSVTINTPLTVVWAAVSDLGSHTDWMADAESIRFTTEQRHGPGTRMEVTTRVGPFRTIDLMEVTDWREPYRIGVRHDGLVSGEGVFELEVVGPSTTRFTWRERLTFPWYLGGPLTGHLASPVLGFIWKRNLSRLRALLDRSNPPEKQSTI